VLTFFVGMSPTAFVTALLHHCCKLSGFKMFTYHWLPAGRSGKYSVKSDSLKERFDA